MNSEMVANAKDVFNIVGSDEENNQAEDELNWLSQLERSEEGKIQKTINNIVLILENDPNLKDKIAIDKGENIFGYFAFRDKYNQLVFLADSAFTITMTQEKFPNVKLHFISEFND